MVLVPPNLTDNLELQKPLSVITKIQHIHKWVAAGESENASNKAYRGQILKKMSWRGSTDTQL